MYYLIFFTYICFTKYLVEWHSVFDRNQTGPSRAIQEQEILGQNLIFLSVCIYAKVSLCMTQLESKYHNMKILTDFFFFFYITLEIKKKTNKKKKTFLKFV